MLVKAHTLMPMDRASRWIVPISGTTKLHHLEGNLGAVADGSPKELHEINAAIVQVKVQVARVPESILKYL